MRQSEIPLAHKEWANLMRSLVGGNCSVKAYYDEPEEHRIHIFASTSEEGVIAATVGLMDIALRSRTGEEIHAEVIMDQRGHDPRLAQILSTIAFYVMKDGWKLAPGVVFEEMVRMYIPDTKLPHVVFVAPWQFDSSSRVALSDRTIYPLVAVPISEAESRLARTDAGRELEETWQRKSVDVLNWTRGSAV
jgi:hypothetical protein